MTIIAYLLVLLSAFVLWGIVAFLIQMLALLIIGKIAGIQQMMLNLVNYISMASFISGISQGFLSLWFGAIILTWLVPTQAPSLFLGVFLAIAFVIPTVTKLSQSQSRERQNKGLTPTMPENVAQNEQMAEMFNMMQQQGNSALKTGASKTTVIGLIGKITGVGIGVLNVLLG
jgi:hypothetical protein